MPTVRAQIVLNKLSAIPADAVTNTFHFETGSATTTTDYEAIRDALVALYAGLVTDNVIAQPLSNAANAHVLKLTNIANYSQDVNTPSGPPDQSYNFSLATVSAITFPAQVSLAVTLEAGSERFSEKVGNTRPAARRRGRIFLPCLRTSLIAQDATSKDVFLDGTARSAILGRFTTMQSSLANLTDPIALVVASRTNATTYPVEDFSIDDTFDVVRSRKVRARSRVRASAVVPVVLAA